jgi:hypothetical protein
MGGLVARSACHHGEVAGHHWRAKLDAMVCLGSPQGALLERSGSWLELLLGASPTCASASCSTRTGWAASALRAPEILERS